jgi:hypothetical protein
MGRTITPRYRIRFWDVGGAQNQAAWPSKHLGAPRENALRDWVRKSNQSVLPGGVNAHIGIRGWVMRAQVEENRAGGEILFRVEGSAPPMFYVPGTMFHGPGGKRRHGGGNLPVEGDECPACQSGTVVLEEGELRCAGECGKIWKLTRGSKKRPSVGKQVAELNKLLK